MKSASGNSNDSDSKSSVHECFVQVFALKRGHASIFPGFSVENEVDRDECGAENTSTIEEALLEVAGLNRILKSVALVAAEGLLEEVARRCKSAWSLSWLLEAAEDVLLWRAVEVAEDGVWC